MPIWLHSLGAAKSARQVRLRSEDGLKRIVSDEPSSLRSADRHFIFFDPESPDQAEEIGRRLDKNLEIADLTGQAVWPVGLGPQQLPLPLLALEEVNF